MIAHRPLFFLTFVLVSLVMPGFFFPGFFSSAHAAKESLSPDAVTEQTDTYKKTKSGPEADGTLVDIAQPPPGPKKLVTTNFEDYFYPYRRAIAVRVGRVFLSTHGLSEPSLTGVQFWVKTEENISYEAGADLMTDGSGSLQISRRFIFADGKFRPFAKLGAGILVIPENGLAVWVNFANYRAHAAIGAEYLLRRSESIRVDFESTWSVNDVQALASAGYVWAW
jgi:hypothetical protein